MSISTLSYFPIAQKPSTKIIDSKYLMVKLGLKKYINIRHTNKEIICFASFQEL